MYKLTVVAGPNRGTTYVIHEGENSIGRQSGNEIVLSSSRVSKRHCTLVVSNGEVVVSDHGSSNGTFVNGELAKSRRVAPGDRISVGEFVLEMSAPPSSIPARAPAVVGLAPVLQFPADRMRQGGVGYPVAQHQHPVHESGLGGHSQPAAPKDPVQRALAVVEERLMPWFYGINLKTEWRLISAGIIGVFLVANVFVAVMPLLDSNRASIVAESGKRARYIARQMVESNVAALAANAEGKTDLGLAETADAVRVAMLLDLKNRVIAPAVKNGQHLVTGAEARFARKAAQSFLDGRESGYVVEAADEGVVVAIEPLKLAGQAGRNVPVAMAVVSIDIEQATLQMGDMGVIYFKSLVLTGILTLVMGVILYRLTLKPFEILSEDLDRGLKGELGAVTHEFRFEELHRLWDLVNSAIQRIPKNDSGGGAGSLEQALNPDDYVRPIEALLHDGHVGWLVFDHERKVLKLNPHFEEISGIRADSAVGQELTAVARDQSMGALLEDLFGRAAVAGESAAQNYDFSGVPHQVRMIGMGRTGEPARLWAMIASKSE